MNEEESFSLINFNELILLRNDITRHIEKIDANQLEIADSLLQSKSIINKVLIAQLRQLTKCIETGAAYE